MTTVAWAAACGDGGTEPPAPPPDPPRATTVTVSPSTAELTALGETVQLRAEVRDQNGQVMSGAAVTWTSSSAAVGHGECGRSGHGAEQNGEWDAPGIDRVAPEMKLHLEVEEQPS